jgi:hypothetical protein
MTDKRTQNSPDPGNMEKDPADWVTGDEPMTGAQRSYLKTLSEEAHEPFDDTLTKAEASRRIDELQARTGRGRSNSGDDANGSAPEATPAQDRAPAPPDAGPLQSLGKAISAPIVDDD